MNKLDAIVYIGRFQPFTNAHYKIVKMALETANKVIIVIGSAKRARNIRNPWTAEERRDMISSIKDFSGYDIEFILQPNSNYNFNWWLKDIQEQVSKVTNKNDKIGIIGYKKDSSSYYLNYFPQWKFIDVPELENGLSATEIRDLFFEKAEIKQSAINADVYQWLLNWEKNNIELFNNLVSEKKFITDYKKKWENAPFQPIFVTTDTMVICKGQILLIKRKYNPGKDLYAMPGGFLNPDEYLKDCAVRELKEETRIDVDKSVLKNSIELIKVFDEPYRETRGRGITHCFLFNLKLKELPKVKGGDDAYGARWIPLGSLDSMQDQFFGDHYQIIKNMLGQID
jgi:bifunctional NMN adenylyltransferase/nudix hydrolase